MAVVSRSYTKLIITITGAAKPYVFNTRVIDELVIGRVDPLDGAPPDIDLTPYQGRSRRVAHKHASIVKLADALYLLDKGSHHGTFVNGLRLFRGQMRMLRDGDHIRLGDIVLNVRLEPSPMARR